MEEKLKQHLWVAIIAGGMGTRLFPISHADRPKQFCRMNDKNTFIQATIGNFVSLGIGPNRIVIVTHGDDQLRLAREQAVPRGVLSQNIISQEQAYGYVGAMVAVADFIREKDPQAVIINTPSDHYLDADGNFHSAISAAIKEARKGFPVAVTTKIGNIDVAVNCGHAIYDETADESGCFTMSGFVEKPSHERADELMRLDNSACSTGILVWNAIMPREIVPDGYDLCNLTTESFMERMKPKIAVSQFDWRDCGTFRAYYDLAQKTPNHKNASLGGGTIERVGCRRSLFYASSGINLCANGVKDAAVVATIIGERLVVFVIGLDETESITEAANNFASFEGKILSRQFLPGSNGNILMYSNTSDVSTVGFIGVKNYIVYSHYRPDGTIDTVVSKQA